MQRHGQRQPAQVFRHARQERLAVKRRHDEERRVFQRVELREVQPVVARARMERQHADRDRGCGDGQPVVAAQLRQREIERERPDEPDPGLGMNQPMKIQLHERTGGVGGRVRQQILEQEEVDKAPHREKIKEQRDLVVQHGAPAAGDRRRAEQSRDREEQRHPHRLEQVGQALEHLVAQAVRRHEDVRVIGHDQQDRAASPHIDPRDAARPGGASFRSSCHDTPPWSVRPQVGASCRILSKYMSGGRRGSA